MANCFSCSALLCANCVIVTSLEAMKKMVKEGKKKPNELDKIVLSVDYSSSR